MDHNLQLWIPFGSNCVRLIFFQQNQDQQTKDTHKALQTMSSMSSAQIVSATAMNKATATGLATLGLGTPVPYTNAVTAVRNQIKPSNVRALT